MTKQEETDDLISYISKGLENRSIKNPDGIKVALICDIAKSLSIIADKMQEKGK